MTLPTLRAIAYVPEDLNVTADASPQYSITLKLSDRVDEFQAIAGRQQDLELEVGSDELTVYDWEQGRFQDDLKALNALLGKVDDEAALMRKNYEQRLVTAKEELDVLLFPPS